MRKRKEVVGIVTSNKMDKTISVSVEYLAKHPRYKKYVKKATVYKAHDPENTCNIGDKVRIEESRPLSKSKRWRLVSVVEDES
jgi:small subunit ribosomal protein S17